MRDVTRKAYRYTIYTGRIRPVRRIRFCWHFPGRLDIEAMQAAARLLVGLHDFRSFAAAVEEGENTVRTVFRCEVAQGIDGDPEPGRYRRGRQRFSASHGPHHRRDPHRHRARALAARAHDRDPGGPHRKAAGHLAPAGGLSPGVDQISTGRDWWEDRVSGLRVVCPARRTIPQSCGPEAATRTVHKRNSRCCLFVVCL